MSDLDDAYGPALPPGLGTPTVSEKTAIIGPVIPSQLKTEGRPSIGPILPGDLKGVTNNKDSARRIGPAWPQRLGSSQVAGGSDSDDDIGPSIGLQAQEEDLSAVREFTARANRMKDKLEDEVKPVDGPAQRESWMTELPEGLGARFGLGARQFRKEEAAEIDSSWTDKPGEHKKEGKKRSHDFTTEADMKAAKEMEKFNKKHRAESLLELHKKELKKKKKKEKKKNKGRERPLERQVFDRERDLKVNKLDEAQRRAIIKRSQELGSRFKSGGTGTSFL
ncbi:GPALPP motifs-containing protein 1-like isoform X2 [Dreissena polymorpha]|uniref:GPALPP motifs-containing protein 1-like isoform X2 n=1 Tax=Dreissena polymorpha TaxID=45954 RepID=UPI00226537D9|nr:GPALPP motifs-containing protein 1-like isoform X2 [Dreissena polymorpha]